MKKCENCEELFDEYDESEVFVINTMLNYDNLAKCLCAACAEEAIDNWETGVYYETCESCGKSFDLAEDTASFYEHEQNISLMDMWDEEILCCECAVDQNY